ncbi:probable E3 ubiquitin-protein ligase RHA1A [Salvia miltiorrhiza]|uniref:probable E3 ubiquitin-protein ligase RHA1A n=1 Tax=Salvia miltiorrhiza TaxID=226208 RepID=UPI0025AC480D|nr:probable E3 ubiquitin-protein ligase RHA1A [Salvia miltiorrhiza]
MKALTKLLCFSNEIVGDVVELLPKLLRLMVLAICSLWKHWKHTTSTYKYASIINTKTSNFAISDSEYCCTICLSEFARGDEAAELVDCRHVFHRRCLERWLRCHRATCPLCRSVVVPEAVVEEYRRTRMDRESDDGIHKELAHILFKVLHDRTRRHRFFF